MNLEQITNQVAELAMEAGAFIREERKNFNRDLVELKGKSDLVSYVDKETEKMLVTRLSEILPDSGFITEEKTTIQETKDYTWIIDPLDGTTNFVHDIPNYCVSIALMNNGEIVSGVVYEIANNECFSAWSGGGTRLNSELIKVNQDARIRDCVFATGFPIYNFEKIDDYLKILNELMKNTHGLRRMGSAAADMAYVACGRYGGYFEYNINAWDIAAGVILVQEAGGTVTDFSGGNNFLFGREMISAGAVHPRLLEVVKTHW
ncbi:MAG: inositol monophosphatase family protein [Cyclobacteriaceae bacterium]